MQLPVTMHMAQKYAVSRDNPEDVFTFLHKNFGCSRRVYNLCVDSLYRQLEAAGYQSGDNIPDPVFPKVSALKKEYQYLKEADAHIENVTLSMEMDGSIRASICYSYTLLVDMALQEAAMNGALPEGITFLGLDYSQQDFYVDNEGRKANYPKYYRRSEERLSLLQRRLSHKEKDSRNYRKLLNRIRKLHTKIKNQRKDFLQKESTLLVSGYDVIVVEDLDLRGMGGALFLGKNLHDNGFGMFQKILAYKLQRKGSCLVKVNRWFPSSKTCSCCGHVLDSLELSDRTYTCRSVEWPWTGT